MSQSRTYINRIDWLTIFLYLLLVSIGLVAIFSVEYKSTDTSFFMPGKSHVKQLVFLGASLFIGMVILMTDSKIFSSFAFLFYTIGLALLIVTIFVGANVKGSHSWLGVGSFRFQPGEVCKIFTSLAIAKFMSMPETNFKTLKDRAIGIALALVPCVIIILQDETGLALVYFCFFLVLYREGLPNAFLIIGFSLLVLTLGSLLLERSIIFYITTGLAILIIYILRNVIKRDKLVLLTVIGCWVLCMLFSQVAIPLVFKNVFKGYQIERIYSMLGTDVPEEYISADDQMSGGKKKDTDYNVRQSKIAIGSGGLFGKGLLKGTSTKNDFVPEQNTDFIFCSIGEQFGFVGSILLIIIYITLMLRILYVAERQRSAFSRIYGYCVACILFFHFAINISMTIGLAPVIGITLPLLSYGGSSLLSFSILIFILLRLDVDRQVLIR